MTGGWRSKLPRSLNIMEYCSTLLLMTSVRLSTMLVTFLSLDMQSHFFKGGALIVRRGKDQCFEILLVRQRFTYDFLNMYYYLWNIDTKIKDDLKLTAEELTI